MKIGILHLTDIHFTEKTDLQERIHPFCQALIKEYRGLERLYFIISGDVANMGKKEEYDKAHKFLSVVKQLLCGECKTLQIRYIFVPGNHDCNFQHDSQLRRNVINTISYQSLGTDNSVSDVCLGVQKNFWEFYGLYNPLPEDKLMYQVKDVVGSRSIAFHCINTAWMSQIEEKVGGLFFPVARYGKKVPLVKGINIGVWHHPYNWFNPNTNENNKKEFERFTEQIASTHFFGHEHEHAFYTSENKSSGETINLLSGELFNDDKKKSLSGFQTVILDIVSNRGELRKYQWKDGIYSNTLNKEIDLDREVQKPFKVKEEYIQELEKIRIPLTIDNNKAVKLSDIFVYPDLEAANNEMDTFESYVGSHRLLEPGTKNCVIDGDSQIGKTSLLSMLYLDYLENDCYPVLLAGRDFKEPNLDKIVRKAFKTQYMGRDYDYELYQQLGPSKKVLLIDDYQDCKFNPTTTRAIFDEASLKFGKVIVVLDAANSIVPSMKAEFHDVTYYSIKPLGYKKRNDLIERYQLLKEDPYTINEQKFIDGVKTSFDNVQAILGDKLIPSYPVFILSILQALEYKPLKQNETSFGYCYQTLIHYSLHKAGVANEDIDTYFNILTELAYHYIDKETDTIRTSEMLTFYQGYEANFICPSYDVLLRTLKKSKIIIEEAGVYSFGYNYILYYLSAKKIADLLHTREGKEMINKLFEKLYEERNANILVFVTHHSKDITFIEQSLLNSMMVLEKIAPITMEKNDPFYNATKEFAEELKNDILEANRNPKDERKRVLEIQDQRHANLQKVRSTIPEEDLDMYRKMSLPFQQSFRSIEIVGQIIRNRKGSLPKPQLLDMIGELYTTGFRTIGYISNMLVNAKEGILEYINAETGGSEDGIYIEKRIERFVQMTSFEACLSVFSKLMHSMGNRDLKQLYVEVARKMGTPAAKLVSFSINSYYGTISPEELKALADELKGNIVALRILRARVTSYVYHRNPDYKTKQKFASYLHMTLRPGIPMKALQHT